MVSEPIRRNPVSQVKVASPPIIVLVGCPGDPLSIEEGGPQETVTKDIYVTVLDEHQQYTKSISLT